LPIDPAAREALDLHQRAEELRLRELRRAARARWRDKSIGPAPVLAGSDANTSPASAPGGGGNLEPVTADTEDADETALAGVGGGQTTKRFVVSRSTITVLTSAARAGAAARQRASDQSLAQRRGSVLISPGHAVGRYGVNSRTSAALDPTAGHNNTGGRGGGRRPSIQARCNDGSLAADVFVDEERDAEEFAPPEYSLCGGFLQRMK
jgi:hypothetical protein